MTIDDTIDTSDNPIGDTIDSTIDSISNSCVRRRRPPWRCHPDLYLPLSLHPPSSPSSGVNDTSSGWRQSCSKPTYGCYVAINLEVLIGLVMLGSINSYITLVLVLLEVLIIL